MHWFTADWHVGHTNIIKLSGRPFSHIDEMDRTIFESAKRLKPGDVLYHLGDIALRRDQALRALDRVPKGVQVHVVFGNHDRPHHNAIGRHARVVWSGSMKSIKIDNQHIILCHYAMRTWDRMHYGSWQLFGHSHGNLDPWSQQLDVGVDSAARLLKEYRPFTFEEVQRLVQPVSATSVWRQRAEERTYDHHDPRTSDGR